MAFIPVLNVLKTVVRTSYGARVYTNTLYWLKSGGWSASGGLLMANTVNDYWQEYVLPTMSDDVNFLDVVAYDMSDSAGFVVTSNANTGTPGTAAGDVLPGNVTAAISLRTDNRGKSGRGRLYHVGLAENQVVANTLVAGMAATLDTAYTNFWNAVESESAADWVVVSFQKDLVVRNPGVAQPIVQILVDANVDSQSRRIR